MITPSLTAYCVSLHPEVWEEIFPDGDLCKLGATYRQRAERYIQELALNYTDYKDHKFFNFQTKFIWDNYTAFHKDNDRYLAERENWEQARRSIKDDEAMKTFLKTNPKPMPKERRAGINRFVAATSWQDSPPGRPTPLATKLLLRRSTPARKRFSGVGSTPSNSTCQVTTVNTSRSPTNGTAPEDTSLIA